jgi:large subunit ribosomal protein L11
MSNKAEPVPPLGTILGNIGVNTIKFCDEFNIFTKNLPVYFLLKVTIYIFENRTFKFSMKAPSTGFLLNLLKFDKKVKVKVHDRIHEKTISCISMQDVLKIALFKFKNLDLEKSVPVVWGSVKSFNLIVV